MSERRLRGAAATAGLQTFGGMYGDAVQGYMNRGDSESTALNKAFIPALAGAASTYLLTAAGGTQGMEALLRQPAFKENFRQWFKAVAAGSVKEGLREEAPDQLIQGIIERYTYNPKKPWKDIIEETLLAGIGGALLGGAAEATTTGLAPAETSQDQPPPSIPSNTTPVGRPSTPPLSVEQSQKLIHNVMNRPPEQRGHPTTQADLAQAQWVVREQVRKLESQKEPLSDVQQKALADAKAALARVGTKTNEPPVGGAQLPAFLVVNPPRNTTLSNDENARRTRLAEDQNRDPARLLESLGGDNAGGTAGGTERRNGETDQTGRSYVPEMGQGRGGIPVLDEERLRKGLSNLEEAGGAEHKVFFDVPSRRAVKLTNPGELGAEERGLSGYLQRLAWHNELFGDHITVEGWVKMPGETTERLVTTQPLRVPDPKRPEPTQKEIDVYMRAHGFLRAYDGAYIHESRDIAASDAVPKNFVREKSGEIHPVDVLLVQPSDSMHSRLTAMAYNEPQVPKSALPSRPGATPDESPSEGRNNRSVLAPAKRSQDQP